MAEARGERETSVCWDEEWGAVAGELVWQVGANARDLSWQAENFSLVLQPWGPVELLGRRAPGPDLHLGATALAVPGREAQRDPDQRRETRMEAGAVAH